MGLHRTQILLTEEQYQRLKALASKEGVPLSALIRRLLEERIGEPRRMDRTRKLREISGIAGSGEESVDHDEVLYRKDW